MDDVALANYVAGTNFGHVEAGRLDPFCARALGLEVCQPIWFSDYTLIKLQHKHGDINYSHYRHLPSILLKGRVARGRKSNIIELWWIDPDSPEAMAFIVVLKATFNGEVYVETFHRLHLKEARRLRRKAAREGRLLRD